MLLKKDFLDIRCLKALVSQISFRICASSDTFISALKLSKQLIARWKPPNWEQRFNDLHHFQPLWLIENYNQLGYQAVLLDFAQTVAQSKRMSCHLDSNPKLEERMFTQHFLFLHKTRQVRTIISEYKVRLVLKNFEVIDCWHDMRRIMSWKLFKDHFRKDSYLVVYIAHDEHILFHIFSLVLLALWKMLQILPHLELSLRNVSDSTEKPFTIKSCWIMIHVDPNSRCQDTWKMRFQGCQLFLTTMLQSSLNY